MTAVNVTTLRQHLPAYLKQVQQGHELSITLHGKTIARLVPEGAALAREAARKRLEAVRGRMIIGDVLGPSGAHWSADGDHL
jgi:prevent-host-death family protein